MDSKARFISGGNGHLLENYCTNCEQMVIVLLVNISNICLKYFCFASCLTLPFT